MSEDSIKMSNLIMRILFESGLYSNADSIYDFSLFVYPKYTLRQFQKGKMGLHRGFQGPVLKFLIFLKISKITLKVYKNIICYIP